ncbi:MAG: serine/threonine-protein kinase [Polyangiaceae bacterium]
MSEARPDSWTPPRSAPRRTAAESFGVRPSQLTGAVLGERYKIHGYLRRGSSARVYLAEDLETDGSVVIKMLSPAAARDSELRQRIEAAQRETQPLQHPNVIDLLGVAQTASDVPYLVMEALAGETLDEALRRLGTLPLDLCLVVARQAAAGVAALHAAGFTHADLKPENLMLLGAPEQPFGVKILNYGIARHFRDSKADAPFDALQAAFLAPEQLLDARHDRRSDVYALGVVLLQTLCGRLPFQGSHEGECVRQKLNSDTLEAFWIDEALDPRLESIVLNATRKHPENRYGSAQELLDDLDVIVGLSSRDVRTRPLSRRPDSYEAESQAGRERLAKMTQDPAP